MLLQGGKDPELHIGERAHGERDLLRRQPRHEAVVLQAPHAVIDAPRLKDIQRLPDVLGRALLAGVHDAREAHLPGLPEDPANLRGGLPTSAESRPTASRCSAKGRASSSVRSAASSLQVAEEAQDQARRDSQLRRAVVEGAADPHATGLERDTTPGVRLRVEEDLGVTHALPGRPGEIGAREVVEVLLGPEHRAVGVVDVEERLEVLEAVGAAQCVHVGVRQVHLVACRHLEHQFGLERPLHVHVELGLGQAAARTQPSRSGRIRRPRASPHGAPSRSTPRRSGPPAPVCPLG